MNIETLLDLEPISNCVVAFSLSPESVADVLDKKAPRVNKRIRAIKKLAKSGWLVGLRLDPLIFCENWRGLYSELIEEIMADLEITNLHSVSFGPLRYPKKCITRLRLCTLRRSCLHFQCKQPGNWFPMDLRLKMRWQLTFKTN